MILLSSWGLWLFSLHQDGCTYSQLSSSITKNLYIDCRKPVLISSCPFVLCFQIIVFCSPALVQIVGWICFYNQKLWITLYKKVEMIEKDVTMETGNKIYFLSIPKYYYQFYSVEKLFDCYKTRNSKLQC